MFYDLFGACASFLSTYYFIHKNVKAWPISLVAIAVNGWLYWQKGIYADMCLESFYFICAAYGWTMWRKSTAIQPTQTPKSLAWKNWVLIIVVIGGLYELVFFLLTTFTHSSVAKLDALTTSLSLVAQALMCHKIIAMRPSSGLRILAQLGFRCLPQLSFCRRGIFQIQLHATLTPLLLV